MIIKSRAPLRLGLGGGGTDTPPYCELYGGYVLNATIGMYAYAILEDSPDGRLRFHATDRNERFEAEAVSRLPVDGLLDLHKGVYNRIVRDFNGGRPLPVTLTTFSDALAGSGLGSSSTMVVCMIQAYVEALNLPLGEYDIAQLAYEIERIDLALSGGKQDQYAATFGGFNFIEFHTGERVIVNPLRIKPWILSELEMRIVLYYTGVSRESSRIIDEQTRNIEKGSTGSLEAMHALKEEAVIMKECLLKGDLGRFARSLDSSWNRKKDLSSSISNDHIERIYTGAKSAGALAGKISGAGGGGYFMFFVDYEHRVRLIDYLELLGQGKVVNCRFTPHGAMSWRLPSSSYDGFRP
jgi:D-glycero-alpha-D-manno-heptose-7-phosphate kinase